MNNSNDNWKDRQTKYTCKTCMWFVTHEGYKIFGRCRKNAPTIHGYPPVYFTDWCGNYRPDEKKMIER